jgi:hypothetical protein
MLMMRNKDKAVSVILGDAYKDKPVEKPISEEYGEGYKMSAQELLNALKGNDVEKAASALKSFVSLANMEHESSEPEDD